MARFAKLDWKERLLILFGGKTLSAILRFLGWSCRMRLVGFDRLDAAMNSGRPVIIAIWHGDIMTVLTFRYAVRLPPMITMVSRSKDGEIAAAVATSVLDITCVRGSSSRGGAMGLLEFRRRLLTAREDGVTPIGLHMMDGPRGPRHRAKAGIVVLAQTSNALVVPIVFGASRRIAFRSWDRHRIPLPFSQCVACIGEPVDFCDVVDVATEAAGERDETVLRTLEIRMKALAESEFLCRRDYELE